MSQGENDDSGTSLREARARYFAANGFGDGGYEKPWVKLQAGPIPIYFPNTQARVRAVKLHDLHHVLTRYATTWLGEAEIGAWEIAAGCGRHYAAWVLNMEALAVGMFLDARRLAVAFRRGELSRSLYDRELEDSLLERTVGEVRSELGLDRPIPTPVATTWAKLCLWSLGGMGCIVLALAPLLLPIWLFS